MNPLNDTPLRTAQFETLLTLNVTHDCLATFIEPQRGPVREAFVSRCATAWAKSLEGAISGHSPGPSCADVTADYDWHKLPSDSVEMPNFQRRYSCGRREKFTISSKEIWVRSSLGSKTGRRKPGGRRPQRSVVKELVPSRPGDPSAKP